MKKLNLDKSFTVEFDNQCPTCGDQLAEGTTKKLTYGDLVKAALNTIPRGGINVEEMGIRMKIREKIEKGDAITLDDADVEKIFTLVKDMGFVIMNKGYIEFHDYLKSIKESEGK